ncbi:hypothetical protein KBD87_04390 [Candidatus Saccharibacteria bacterium]|nr:hypothetical protein [Candidatus Saccharibacteria bacterium]
MKKQSSTRVQPGILQKYSVLFMLFIIFWLTAGRSLLGSDGWLSLVIVSSWVPLLLAFTGVLAVTSSIRYRRTGYVFSKTMNVLFSSFLAGAFVGGFFLMDGGDTPESIGSVFTKMTGISDFAHPLIDVTQNICTVLMCVMPVLMMVMLIFVFVDKGAKK